MKPIQIIQRLCLFLLLVASSVGAWATDYGCAGYAIFRSRDVGRDKTVTTLNGEHVKITFSNCKTSNAAQAKNLIFEPARGSYINVEAADGYAIRWIILRDTEGSHLTMRPMEEVLNASIKLLRAMTIILRRIVSLTRA